MIDIARLKLILTSCIDLLDDRECGERHSTIVLAIQYKIRVSVSALMMLFMFKN